MKTTDEYNQVNNLAYWVDVKIAYVLECDSCEETFSDDYSVAHTASKAFDSGWAVVGDNRTVCPACQKASVSDGE